MPNEAKGFRGVRNEDTTAARAKSIEVRKAAALKRRIHDAMQLLDQNGYFVMLKADAPPPTDP